MFLASFGVYPGDIRELIDIASVFRFPDLHFRQLLQLNSIATDFITDGSQWLSDVGVFSL